MTETPSTTANPAVATPELRPGIPVWRVGKPDAALAADVDTARAAVQTIASDAAIGKHLGARSEGVRCVTHLFESKQPGYSGWVWFASLSRIARGKYATVNEVGMLPTEAAVLAPAWVPWAERVRPEDQQEAAALTAANAAFEADAGAGPAESGSAAAETEGDSAWADGEAAADAPEEHESGDGSDEAYDDDDADAAHAGETSHEH